MREGLLIPFIFGHEDSGIDSDDTEHVEGSVRRPGDSDQFAETSSSDEDLAVKPPWARSVETNNFKNIQEAWMDSPKNLIPMMPWQGRAAYFGDSQLQPSEFQNSPDRYSPPLYEVELTASDEDEDSSVLELVIKTSEYKRVPPSLPIKNAFTATMVFCNWFFCLKY